MKISRISKTDLGQVEEVVEVSSMEDLARVAGADYWAPGTFKDGRRLRNGLESIELLCLDIDEGATAKEVSEVLDNYKYLIMASRNHLKEKNGKVEERFRVILWVSEPITNDRDFKATWTAFKDKLTFPIDEACKDSSRFFYPSPEVLFENPIGRNVSVVKAPPEVVREAQPSGAPEGVKGSLWKSTLDFLLNGAPSGTRHNRLVSCIGNMKEQGHDLPEIITRVEEMTLRADWTQPGLSPKDLHTINDVFNRPNKYEFRPKDMDAAKPLASGSIEGITLIDEMFTYVRDKDRMLGTSTGIEGLDKMLGGGIRKGELNVLAASGKTGKSSLFHYLIYNLLMAGHRVSYASRELTPATEVLPNLLSIDTGQNIYKLEPEQINESYVDLVKGIVGRWPLSFAEGYGVFSIEEIENWVRTEKDKGTEFFFADHLHHFVMTEDHQEVAKVIKHIKTLTKKYDICMNLIVQPRTLREGEKVNLNTIRGGAVIHQTLDNLFVFERMKNQTDISKLILESARHKLCRPGEIYLKYDQDSMRFEEVVKELVQPGEMEQEYGSYTKQRHKWQGHRI